MKYDITVLVPFQYFVTAQSEEQAKKVAVETAQDEIDGGTVGEINQDVCKFEVKEL